MGECVKGRGGEMEKWRNGVLEKKVAEAVAGIYDWMIEKKSSSSSLT